MPMSMPCPEQLLCDLRNDGDILPDPLSPHAHAL